MERIVQDVNTALSEKSVEEVETAVDIVPAQASGRSMLVHSPPGETQKEQKQYEMQSKRNLQNASVRRGVTGAR